MELFISYSWSNFSTADEIDNDFKNFGILFKRDIRDTKYKTILRDYMKMIREADFVLMLISDEFLKSKNCMFEAIELLHTDELNKRILPVLLDNANLIFDANFRTQYYEYWKNELKKANTRRRLYPNVDTINEAKYCNSINDNLPEFLETLKELKI